MPKKVQKTSDTIEHIHDKFFKCSLKEKGIAIDFLKAHLPAELLERMEIDTLELTDKSVIPHRLREIHSDIVYRCRIDGKAAYILFLIEHQSTPDEFLPFRQLQYKVGLMDNALRQGSQTLPLARFSLRLPLCRRPLAVRFVLSSRLLRAATY